MLLFMNYVIFMKLIIVRGFGLMWPNIIQNIKKHEGGLEVYEN